VICKRANPNRRGEAFSQPLGISEYPREIVGSEYVTYLPKSGVYGHISVFIMVCLLTKMAHFVPCHKKINAKESAYLFTSIFYRLHGISKVVVSDRDPKFVGKIYQSCMGKLNTKLNINTARHLRTDGLTERVNQAMQTLMRCYCAESGFDWTSL
jgi:hypothetical protein